MQPKDMPKVAMHQLQKHATEQNRNALNTQKQATRHKSSTV